MENIEFTEENIQIVDESVVVETPAVEVVAEPEPAVEAVEVVEPIANPVPEKPKYKEPKAVTLEDIQETIVEPAGPAVVSGNEVDDVKLSAVVYKNQVSRKSLTVHHVQRRLNELGYQTKDRDGYYSDGTVNAVKSFQKANGIAEGELDADTFLRLFKGDPNVNPIV